MNEDYIAAMDELERLTRVIEALKEAMLITVKPWIIEAIIEEAYNK